MMDPALLERAAELGNAEAQYALGAALLTGHGRPKDLSRAVELCRLAAKQNHAAAQCNLGVLYAQGLGVEQDYERARSFYEASANQGDPNGCFNLALLYAEGVACDKDFAKAASLARSARDLGHPEAAAFLETLPGQDEYVLAQLRDLRARSRKLLEELQMDQPVRSKDLSAWAKQLEDMDDAENLVPRKDCLRPCGALGPSWAFPGAGVGGVGAVQVVRVKRGSRLHLRYLRLSELGILPVTCSTCSAPVMGRC
ncbi:unnamed protein product [Durusdinium trenchii]